MLSHSLYFCALREIAVLESSYQAGLIKEIKRRHPGVVILKNDTGYQQGIPDLSIYLGPRWGMLESKAGIRSKKQPNQDYWVDYLNDMSFAAFIHPDNTEVVLDELAHAIDPRRYPRFLVSK